MVVVCSTQDRIAGRFSLLPNASRASQNSQDSPIQRRGVVESETDLGVVWKIKDRKIEDSLFGTPR